MITVIMGCPPAMRARFGVGDVGFDSPLNIPPCNSLIFLKNGVEGDVGGVFPVFLSRGCARAHARPHTRKGPENIPHIPHIPQHLEFLGLF